MRRGTSVRRSTGRKIWVSWDCPYCETTGIHGSVRECPNCGRPRSTSTKYNTSDLREDVSDEDRDKVEHPDWMCECCDSYNNWRSESCESCGAPKGASKDYFDIRRSVSSDENSSGNDSYNSSSDTTSLEESGERKSTYFAMTFLKSRLISFIVILLTSLSIVGVSYGIYNLINKEIDTTVDGLTWEYSINVERVRTNVESDWSMPSDGRQIDKVWRLKEKDRKVLDHYEDQEVEVVKTREVYVGDEVTYDYVDDGNGAVDEIEIRTPIYDTETYTDTEIQTVAVYRYEDVYDWWYTYEYDEWYVVRTPKTSGTYNEEPYWPDISLSDGEREGNSYEVYKMSFMDEEGSIVTGTVDKNMWDRLSLGDEVTLSYNNITNRITIKSLNGDLVK